MKLQLVFATNNKNKLKEARAILKDKVDVVSLADIQCFDDIDETASTLEGNALIKARYIYEHYHQNCFSDDTGLEIPALSGEPGVYSARYAGEDKDSNANMQKVLDKLKDKDNRSAQFRTVIALIIDGKEYSFEGIVKGEITKEKHGNSGFGYDPIFRPEESSLTFAEMPLDEKNKISHRGRALEKLNEFLKAYSFLADSLSDSSF
jgi:XTP/dITP diphosphohydrolase